MTETDSTWSRHDRVAAVLRVRWVLAVLAFAFAGTVMSAVVQSPGQERAGQELEQKIEAFVGVPGYTPVHLSQAFWDDKYYTTERFPQLDGWTSVRMPDTTANPVQKAILLLEAREGVLPHVRYHIGYRRADVNREVAFVTITRFNLGPVLRREIIATAGSAHAPPPGALGAGPNVSWRLVLMPVHQGQWAHPVRIVRRELPLAEARRRQCFDVPCLATRRVTGTSGDWQPFVVAKDVSAPADASWTQWPDPGAAAAADALFDQLVHPGVYGEFVEGLPAGEPSMEIVISRDVHGQDGLTSAVVHQTHLMDDAIKAMWTERLVFGPNVEWRRLPVSRRNEDRTSKAAAKHEP